MENSNQKGTEFTNVIETWEQNEKKRRSAGNTSGIEKNTVDEAPAGNELEQLIKQEATEYDTENKENRILSGDRATINDDANESTLDE